MARTNLLRKTTQRSMLGWADPSGRLHESSTSSDWRRFEEHGDGLVIYGLLDALIGMYEKALVLTQKRCELQR
jgi:hypothetical protein